VTRSAELSEAAWAPIEPLMPQAEGRSRPWRDHRQVVEGIVFRYRTGVAWRDLPERFGPWQTVWKRHHRFATDGTRDMLLRVIQSEADAAARVDWSVAVDSSIVRAHQHSATANVLFGEALNTNRGSIGLPLVDNVRDYVIGDQPWLATDPTLDPWQETPDLDVIQTGAWILPNVRPLPAELVAFLDAGTPPVYVGFGSMPMRASTDAAQVAIEAIRAQGRRALVGSGWADLALIDDRDDCIVIGEVNQQAHFGRVAPVEHHGGAGTTTTAARAGAPQVVVPQAADQPYWAGRVADLGVGTAHDGPTPTTESLSDALRTALTPETRARATAVAGTIRTDGTTVAATLLLDAVSRERPPESA
jgi:transposase